MSSEISTRPAGCEDHSLQPWQFCLLATLACGAVGVYMARGQEPIPVILYAVLIATAVLIGIALLRTLNPLVRTHGKQAAMTPARASLEREKMLILRSIKELEFDYAMGKLSDADWLEMSTRLRSRAAGLIR
jgi:hypothetical protein